MHQRSSNSQQIGQLINFVELVYRIRAPCELPRSRRLKEEWHERQNKIKQKNKSKELQTELTKININKS